MTGTEPVGSTEVGVVWSIAEVARMSKVTSRTLRHYDDVGLLRPAYVGSNGYRYYEQEQLLRLQQVLLLRELGLGLGAIAEVLAGDRDQVAALHQHERWLHSERDRLGQLADTVARTIRQLQGDDHMTAPELFEGFADQQAQLEEDLVTEHGEGVREHFRTARQVTKDWSQQDYLDAQRRGEELDDKVLAVMRSGAAPGSRAALEVMAEHYQGVTQFWTPDRESYPGLGRMYVDNPEFKARYDSKALGDWCEVAALLDVVPGIVSGGSSRVVRGGRSGDGQGLLSKSVGAVVAAPDSVGQRLAFPPALRLWSLPSL